MAWQSAPFIAPSQVHVIVFTLQVNPRPPPPSLLAACAMLMAARVATTTMNSLKLATIQIRVQLSPFLNPPRKRVDRRSIASMVSSLSSSCDYRTLPYRTPGFGACQSTFHPSISCLFLFRSHGIFPRMIVGQKPRTVDEAELAGGRAWKPIAAPAGSSRCCHGRSSGAEAGTRSSLPSRKGFAAAHAARRRRRSRCTGPSRICAAAQRLSGWIFDCWRPRPIGPSNGPMASAGTGG